MKQKLTDNMGLKILAILFSIVLWLIAINITDPVTQDSYNVTVQMQNMNSLTSSGKYVEILDGTDSIRVTVRGSRTLLSSFTEKNIVAVADVNKMNSDLQVPIELSTTRISDKIESIRSDKQYVQLSVENIGKQQIPVIVKVQNEPGEGYILGSATTTQNVEIISGPESLVNNVSYAAVEINVDGATSDVNISLPIHLYDKNDEIADSSKITMSMSEVYTTASILQTKELPIVCGVTGSILDGYALTGRVECDPDTITVAGRSNQVKNLSSIEITDAIDITGCDSNVISQVDIRDYIPEGLTLVGGSEAGTVNVTVYIEKETEREFSVPMSKIHVTGTPNGYTAELAEHDDYMGVTLRGLNSLLNSVNPDNIVGVIDINKYMNDEQITELTNGNYMMQVEFTLPDGIKTTREYRLRVKVSEEQ